MASQLSADEVAALLRKENVKEDVIKTICEQRNRWKSSLTTKKR